MAMNCVDDVDTILGRTSLTRSDLGVMGFGSSSEKLRMINQLRHDLQSLQAEVRSIQEHMKAHGATEVTHEELSKLETEVFSKSTIMSETLRRVPLETRMELMMRKMVFQSSNQTRVNFITLLDARLYKIVYSITAMDGELKQLKKVQEGQAADIMELYKLVGALNQRIPKKA